MNEIVLVPVLYAIALLPPAYLRYAPFRTLVDEDTKDKLLWAHIFIFVMQIMVIPWLFYTAIVPYTEGSFTILYRVGYLPYVFVTAYMIRPYWYQHLFILGIQGMYMVALQSIVSYWYGESYGMMSLVDYFCVYIGLFCVGLYPMRMLLDYIFIEAGLMHRVQTWKWIGPVPLLLSYYQGYLMYAEHSFGFFNTWQHVFQLLAFILLAYSLIAGISRLNYLAKVLHRRNETQQQMDWMNRYATQLREEERKLSIIRHDTRHHLHILAELIEKGETEQASAFIERLREEARVQHD